VCSALFVYCFVDKEGMRQQLRRQLVQDGLFHFKVDWSTFLGVHAPTPAPPRARHDDAKLAHDLVLS
jgi:hypothetical protein